MFFCFWWWWLFEAVVVYGSWGVKSLSFVGEITLYHIDIEKGVFVCFLVAAGG